LGVPQYLNRSSAEAGAISPGELAAIPASGGETSVASRGEGLQESAAPNQPEAGPAEERGEEAPGEVSVESVSSAGGAAEAGEGRGEEGDQPEGQREDEGGEPAGGGAGVGAGSEAERPNGPGSADEAEPSPDSDLGLIDEELAEHQRWAASFGSLGTAGSDERARFLLEQTGQGAVSGAEGALLTGAAMGAISAAIGQIAGRRLAALAVSRGVAATPVPGLGAAIGGVMAVAGLVQRDWGSTFDTIGRIGEGEGYEGLANTLEGVAEALDLATSIMDVVAGVLGGIAVGMWVAAVLSAGTLSPLAASLSGVALAISAATTSVGLIITVVVRPTVTALRALHAFESRGDPATIEAAGQSLQGAAGQITGAVVGSGAGRLGGAVGGRLGTRADAGVARIQARSRGGRPQRSAAAGPGPRIHLEVPEAPTRTAREAGGPIRAAAEGGAPPAAGPATAGPAAAGPAAAGPAAAAPGGQPRASSRRPVAERVHNQELRALRDGVEKVMGVELTPEQTRRLDILRTMDEAVHLPDPELQSLPGPQRPRRAQRGDPRAWTHGDPDPKIRRREQQRVESSLRSEARAEATQDLRTAISDESQHTPATLESRSHLEDQGVDQIARLAEEPVPAPRRGRRGRRSGGESEEGPVRGEEERRGELPEDWDYHHRATVRDHPEQAGSSRSGVLLPSKEHVFVEHGGDIRAEVETMSPRDPGALTGPRYGYGSVRESQPRVRRVLREDVARGFSSTGDAARDSQIEYSRPSAASRGLDRDMARRQAMFDRVRAEQQRNPTAARQRTIDRLEAEFRAEQQFLEATLGRKPARASGASGPAASSPVPGSRFASHTQTIAPTRDRAAAMAQYHEQIRTDPGRESGVWRDAAGNYHVMQGDAGSVSPPAAAGPLELIYHSHPTHADANAQGMMSLPSQAEGDISVLQYQHGQGPVGRRQDSELHFPVYDENGNHAGYGATRFRYDPTSPLPIQVATTRPGGGTSIQRYESFADFEARSGIQAGGDTPQLSREAADVQLRRDQAAAEERIRDVASALQGPPQTVGVREAREAGRREIQADDQGESAAGPGYTAQVAGLEPGESIELPIHPAYPEPPGNPEELAALQDQAAAARAVRADLEATRAAMNSQAATQQNQAEELVAADAVATDLATARQTHQQAVQETSSTNSQQQGTASEAITSLGRSAEEATALTTLVVSLRGFQGLAELFSYLPGGLGRQAEQASRDADRLIASLNRVSETEAIQGDVAAGAEAMQANAAVIQEVSSTGAETDVQVVSGRQGIEQLTAANATSLQETRQVEQQAIQEEAMAQESELEAETSHEDLLARLQSWAQAHRQARQAAIDEAVESYTGLGYRAQAEL
jgi:hypothetical protein